MLTSNWISHRYLRLMCLKKTVFTLSTASLSCQYELFLDFSYQKPWAILIYVSFSPT